MKRFLLFFALSVYVLADATIFVYHRFGDDRYPTTNTPMQELKKEFAYFKDNGYEVITLDRLLKAMKQGRQIPDSWVVLTIDDSYKSFYENGLPVFKEYDYPFTLFVQSKTLTYDSQMYMDKSMVKEAAKYGDIGCHSHSHAHMPTKTRDFIKEDTQKCQEILTDLLGSKPKYYAYPYGEYNPEVKEVIKSVGFEAVLNQSNGSVNAKSDPHNLFRMALVGNVDNFESKFGWKYMDASWNEPLHYPKDGKIDRVSINVGSSDPVQFYVSGHGWSDWVYPKEGKAATKLGYELEKDRVRVFVKDEHSRFHSITLTKGDIYAQ